MLKSLSIRNFTVFGQADLSFGANLNVIVGENGTGKTHLLKLAYAMLAVSAEEARKADTSEPTKSLLQPRLAAKLVNVFRPESLGRLARRGQGLERSEVEIAFADPALDLAFNFSTRSSREVGIDKLPARWLNASAAYFPTRELLSIYPGFVSVYESHILQFDETLRDTCILLGAPLRRGTKEKRIQELLAPLEDAMGGVIELDAGGRFYLRSAAGRLEIPLVAEGLRKVGMLARLVATGALLDNGYLFWDEPEANLNAKLIKGIARSILDVSGSGVQIFIATHSLFLLRELEMLLAEKARKVDVRFFGLHPGMAGVQVEQGSSISDIGDIVALDEDLEQSDRFLEAEI